MINIQNLYKCFRKRDALTDISATLDYGQAIALIGPNGSGKTTLIKCILGLVKPDKGAIFIENAPINDQVLYRYNIGYMPQIGQFPGNMKVRQLFDMIKSIRPGKKNIDEELYHRFRLDDISNKAMGTLSGGTRQKVSAALAFLFDPSILILDEPTAGLDPLASEILKEKINHSKSQGKLVLITSHVLSDLEEITTDIMYLQESRMIFYKPLHELQLETGENKLSKAIASVMKRAQTRDEVHYLKIAK